MSLIDRDGGQITVKPGKDVVASMANEFRAELNSQIQEQTRRQVQFLAPHVLLLEEAPRDQRLLTAALLKCLWIRLRSRQTRSFTEREMKTFHWVTVVQQRLL